MRPIASRVAITPDERLAAITRPERSVVVGRRIPNHLVEELWEFDGMGCRARAIALKGPARRVGDMRGVVCAIKIDSIPASNLLATKPKGRNTHVGNRTLDMIPAGHGCTGILVVSPVLVEASCRHVKVSWRFFDDSAAVRYVGLPTTMRNPFLKAVTLLPSNGWE